MAWQSIDPMARNPDNVPVVGTEIMLALPSDAGAPALARAYLAEHADGLPDELIDDALLLVSELVTNAVQHGRPDIILRIRKHPPGIGVSVQDEGEELLARHTGAPDLQALGGRGLLLVDALASEWGVEPAEPPPGKIVWLQVEPPHVD